jgi:hypothetical protein
MSDFSISGSNGKAGIHQGNRAEGQLVRLLAQAILAQALRHIQAQKTACPADVPKSFARGGVCRVVE